MLMVFKSDAAGDVIMFGDVAKRLIAAMGKDPADAKGIVTVEQLPEAAARLRVLIEEEKARAAAAQVSEEDEEAAQEAGRTGMAAPVNLAQRAWPLLEMLEYSIKEGVPVVWGV
jgi:formiminotetrahydrofolate cyclodeaminase